MSLLSFLSKPTSMRDWMKIYWIYVASSSLNIRVDQAVQRWAGMPLALSYLNKRNDVTGFRFPLLTANGMERKGTLIPCQNVVFVWPYLCSQPAGVRVLEFFICFSGSSSHNRRCCRVLLQNAARIILRILPSLLDTLLYRQFTPLGQGILCLSWEERNVSRKSHFSKVATICPHQHSLCYFSYELNAKKNAEVWEN